MRLGQAQVVSVVIIIVIALGALALVLPWTYGMIQKKKDMKSLDDVYNFFQTLDETIRNIAKNGGEESLSLKVPGKLTVYPELVVSPFNNSIVFSFSAKVSNIAPGGWIPLNTPNMNEIATLGVDTSSVILGRATQTDSEMYIQYKLWYRTLIDTTGRGYKIVLSTTDNEEKSTTTGFLRIQRVGSGGTPLTITEINVIV
jgi:hypothetical protein